MLYSDFYKTRNDKYKRGDTTTRGFTIDYFIDNSLIRPNDLVDMYEKPSFTNSLELTHIGFSVFPGDYKLRNAYF